MFILQSSEIVKHGSLFLFFVPVLLLNVYASARLVNIIRVVWSTRFFTKKQNEEGHINEGEEPHVTIQICSYNEGTVIEPTIDAACSVNWPRDKLCVQVLDDSTEEESQRIARERAEYWRREGINCQYLTRPDRVGYKAGNLAHHLPSVKGPFMAIMDSDHLCESDFLLKTVPHFYDEFGHHKYDVGLVQTPWSFRNIHDNLLSELDALNSDIHHVIEQQGRSNSLSCFSFNGTGGVWRKDAIVAGKGFSWDTVTEDLDLSYISHLAGYRFVYVPDAPQLLESPSNILAYRQQKHRWNKGFFQVYRKSMQMILECDHLPLQVRVESFMHITSPIACCFGLVTLLMIPMIMFIHDFVPLPLILFSMGPSIVLILAGTVACYAKTPGSNESYSTVWERTKRLRYIPLLLCLAMGTCIYDTRAVLQGMTDNDATFLRTPKVGNADNDDDTSFDLFENQDLQHGSVTKKESTETGFADLIPDKQTKELVVDFFFVLSGYFFGIYLLVMPFVDLYLWGHKLARAEIRIYEYMLSPALSISSFSLFAYHGKMYLEMDKSLLVSALKASFRGKEQAANRKRGYIRRCSQCFMLILTLALGRAGFRYSPRIAFTRAERRFGTARANLMMGNGVTQDLISFDLGGSGLKAMRLLVSDEVSEDGKVIKRVTPVGNEVNLGRIPVTSFNNTYNTYDWLYEAVEDKLSFEGWSDLADYGFSGPHNTFKLFGKTEIEAISVLVQEGRLDDACKHIIDDVPFWAQNDVSVWCSEWYKADKVLGLVNDLGRFSHQHNLGSFSDGMTHFEGARARLELMEIPMTNDQSEPFVFVNWALGTGQAITWTTDLNRKTGEVVPFHPALNQTASEAPNLVSVRNISPILSTDNTSHIYEILVDIPEGVKIKYDHIMSWTGDKQSLDKPLPFWMIFSGYMWSDSGLSQGDLQQIYRSFFKNKVIEAIERGDLPRPSAMVFSGGQEEHFHIAEMLSDILDEHGIKSVAGLDGGSHCGVARLSFPTARVVCQFDRDNDANHSTFTESSSIALSSNALESSMGNLDVHLPRILLAGVQKSGSTAIAYFLNQLGVCLSRPNPSVGKEKKEVHFFDRSSTYEKGVGYYSDLFAHCEDEKLITDATPEIFMNARRVKETYDAAGQDTSSLKIVIVVREPVARELSWYNHQSANCYLHDEHHCKEQLLKSQIVNGTSEVRFPSFTEYTDSIFGNLMEGKALSDRVKRWAPSLYGDHLEEWLRYFERKQILVLSYTELKQDEQSFLQRIVSFLDLDVDPALIQSGTDQKNNKNNPGTHKVGLPTCSVQKRLSDAFAPSSDKFFSLLDQGEGPEMEQRPFPRFELSNCTAEETTPPIIERKANEDVISSPSSTYSHQSRGRLRRR